MPVGAIIGTAVVGAGTSLVASGNNSRAIREGTEQQTQSTREAIAAQERARSENLALQTPIYQAGMPAMYARNALLGLGGAPAQAAQPDAYAQPTAYGQPNALTRMSSHQMYGVADGAPDPYRARAESRQSYFGTGGVLPNPQATGSYTSGAPSAPAATTPSQTPAEAQMQAFENFRNSSGYQFRLGEGMNALNSGYAAAGTLQSGAAMRAAQEYGQNLASAEFGNYWNMLGEQQNLAPGAANAMSGVNTTYANNAGNLAMMNGNAQANAAVARANNTNAMIGGVTGSLAYGVGALDRLGML